MQNSTLKFLYSFFLLTFLMVFNAGAQSGSNDLLKADSLFSQKRYTQAFEIYRNLFSKHEYSPAMLLKMAYTEEGLGHVANVQYYLSIYYQVTQDDAVLQKMAELATKYRLEGFETDESDVVLSWYDMHTAKVSAILFLFIALVYVTLLWIKLKAKRTPVLAFSLLVVLSVVLLLHLNASLFRNQYAITSASNTYLMDAPSAGASVVSIVRDGHRIRTRSKKDVWVQAVWGDKTVYIKESSLMPVRL